MRYVYPDTSVWNCLCDQNDDARALWLALEEKGLALVLGFNVLFEIAKQFFTGTEEATERGRELLAYLKNYLALRVPIVKENWALLVEEALDATRHHPMDSCFRDDTEYQQTVHEIEKLCRGDVEPEAARFFKSRKSAARASRAQMREHLEARPDLKAILVRTSKDALPDFLRTASQGPAGQFLLLGHLRMEFPENSLEDLAGVARLLLLSPRYRVSHALTRSGLYLNWRCANRGSIRSDLPDDTFHIVSAAYSDVFATTETDQANIAGHAIEGIQTLVCDQSESISDQLKTT